MKKIFSARVVWCVKYITLSSILFVAFQGITNSESEIEYVRPEVGNLNGRKVVRFHTTSNFIWCGPDQLALSHGGRAGIALLDVNSGSLRKVTQSQTDHAVACTSDGRYVFFTDTSAHGNLSVVDVDSRIQRMIYSNNKFNHWIIEEAPISPSGRHVIGPVTLNSEIELSDRRLRGLTLPSLLSDEYISGIAWAHDDQLYLLFGSEILRKLMILDIKNNMASVINLPQIKGYIFGRISWAEQGQLFLQTVADAELAPRLYTIDIKNPKESLKIIGDGIDDFSVLPDGSVVYTQATGVNYQMDRSVIEPETAYQILAKRNPQGSIETLISLPYLSSGMLGIQASQSSQAIAFTQQPTPGDFNRSVINVLYLNK